jgi:hypothetical protein
MRCDLQRILFVWPVLGHFPDEPLAVPDSFIRFLSLRYNHDRDFGVVNIRSVRGLKSITKKRERYEEIFCSSSLCRQLQLFGGV